MKSGTEQLVSTIQKEITFFASTPMVKQNIGDSIFNNRVPSVRQVIRYLNTSSFGTTAGQRLEAAYSFLRKKNLFSKVRRNNNRTDAYDINEFFIVVRKHVKDPALKGQLTKAINSAV